MDSLDQHTQHRWINNKVVCEHFPFDMYQNQFLMSIRDEMFSVEKWLGGGSFGRVFLARPVSNRYVGTLAAWVKQRFSKKSLRWSPTGGRCLAIKFLDKAGGAHDIEMINKRFPYHENVSRPRFWLSSGWTTGRDLHVAPTKQGCTLFDVVILRSFLFPTFKHIPFNCVFHCNDFSRICFL